MKRHIDQLIVIRKSGVRNNDEVDYQDIPLRTELADEPSDNSEMTDRRYPIRARAPPIRYGIDE